MEKWMKNGCTLGWLIDPSQKKTYIYKVNDEWLEVNGFDQKLSGEGILPGFELPLSKLL
jgi:Uma2 family endonuclease